MRWSNRKNRMPEEGTTRTVIRFLWLPIAINGRWRWLEKAWIEQTVKMCDVGGSMEWGNVQPYWINTKWCDKEKCIEQLKEMK